MSKEIGQATDNLRRFMFSRVYKVLAVNDETERARSVVRRLYHHLVKHQELLPPEYINISDEPERRVVDYIAGMTDQYALGLVDKLGI
jgi:dGTPase